MSVTETTTISDTTGRESSSMTQTLTTPEPGEVPNMAQEAETNPPADFTTANPVAEGVKKGQVAHRGGVGSLTITPDQTILTPEQKAAFASLGVDPNDPVARAHVRRFLHVCQLWNVDPWSGEIHLVQRGKIWDNGEDKRTWTIQTGIDGYRRRARNVSETPGTPIRWIGKAKWYWSYGDDDPHGRGWRETRDEDTGEMILTPAWYDSWPDSRGEPALAKAVIVVEDTKTGERRAEQFVANWKMFAVYEQVWEGRKKVLNPDGSPKMKLGAFWEKGPQHMLAKVAEAQALRAIFHGHFHGVYADEEMYRADADAAAEIEEAVARRRREAFRQAQQVGDEVAEQVGDPGRADAIRAAALAAADRPPFPAVLPGTVVTDPDPGPADPVPVGALLADVAPMSEADRLRLLYAEIDWISELIQSNVRTAITRRARKNLDDMTADELLTSWVGPLRASVVIPHLQQAGRTAEADSYATFGPRYIASIDVLTGRADPATDLATDTPEDAHTDAPQQAAHPFDPREDDDARCSECDGFEDDTIHTGRATPPA